MMLRPAIVAFPGIRLAGLRGAISFQSHDIGPIWRSFGLIYNQFPLSFAAERYSVSIYPEGFFEAFNPAACFEKWAAAPLAGDTLPSERLQVLEIPPGLYAVFAYRGRAAAAQAFFAAIHNEWLPASGFRLDDRPHFEILPPDYRPDDADAREDVYIPVRRG